MTPGYKTTEHAIVWAIILLGAIAIYRSRDAIERYAALVAPAIASAAYSHSRGKAKAAGPFVDRATLLAQVLSDVFEHRR